jgi:hypothetical protein
MDAVSYERCRLAKAKEIGCRASFLDKTVSGLREEILMFEARCHPNKTTHCEDVTSIILWREDDSDLPTWMLARSEDDKQQRCLVLLTDGSLKVNVGARPK